MGSYPPSAFSPKDSQQSEALREKEKEPEAYKEAFKPKDSVVIDAEYEVVPDNMPAITYEQKS